MPLPEAFGAGLLALETFAAILATFERLQARKQAALAAGETTIPISAIDEIFADADKADTDWAAELKRLRDAQSAAGGG